MATLPTSQIDTRKQHGRAVNAVADYLRQKLHIPNVYIEPGAPVARFDVLAVDRAGSGDIYAVEIKILQSTSTNALFEEAIRKLKTAPAHYKYLAVPRAYVKKIDHIIGKNLNLLFPTDGIGRVGILLIGEELGSFSSLPKVSCMVEAERFRVESSDLDRIDRYLTKNKPDMFVRI